MLGQPDKCLIDYLKKTDALSKLFKKTSLQEYTILFPPTYRYQKDLKERVFHPWKDEHGRLPGYADRILFKPSVTYAETYDPDRIQELFPSSSQNLYATSTISPYDIFSSTDHPVLGSDHLPVVARFSICGEDVRVITFNCSRDTSAVGALLERLNQETETVATILMLQEASDPIVQMVDSQWKPTKSFSQCGFGLECFIEHLCTRFVLALFFKEKMIKPGEHDAAGRLFDNIQESRMCHGTDDAGGGMIKQLLKTKGLMYVDVYIPTPEPNEPHTLRVINLHAPFDDQDTMEKFFLSVIEKHALPDTPSNVATIAAGDYNSRSLVAMDGDRDRNWDYTKDIPETCSRAKRQTTVFSPLRRSRAPPLQFV